MSEEGNNKHWWTLHLKKARGQELSEAEQQIYDAEVARLDRTDTGKVDIDALKKLRAEVAELAEQNDELRTRAAELQGQIHNVEKALSKETRDLLGVEE